MNKRILLYLFALGTLIPYLSQGQKKKTSAQSNTGAIDQKTSGMQKFSGYFDFYWNEKTGKIWLEIDKINSEFLYVNSLAAGVGSNDIGLDRGQLGSSRVVKFIRSGPKILLIQPNYSYRAVSNNTDEKKAVEEAFAQSVLWGFKAEAEQGGKILVDFTDFLLRDAHNIIGKLRGNNQGSFSLDKSRSAVYMQRTKGFPKNSEFEALLTYKGSSPGGLLRSVVPTSSNVTVRQHHSFVELPDNNYKPRKYDPRSGYGSISFMDYATPISERIVKKYISRHRLEKKDPSAAVSEAVEPIIYYLDRGTPEPIRSALLDGARWWNEAYEAIGYKNAFQVKILPEGADPLDVRYNMIQWVHRSTRGWSYGSSVRDPRTGEIIKGHVSLGSLRVRQDFLIAQGLIAPYEEGKPVSKKMEEMALARLRQLSAHEVGHTIGLMHNYASSYNDRASVMDYPHPLIKLDAQGEIDLKDAYDVGIGEWDKVTVAFGYQHFPANVDEDKELNKILGDAFKKGLKFISDQDSRAQGSAHPTSHLWDNGTNAADELNRLMKIRKKALDNFSEKNIKVGEPMATLEEVLVPVYLLHRYQIEAAVKAIGGLDYTYALRGDGQLTSKMVSAADQDKALKALLNALKPEILALPESILKLLPPRPVGFGRSRETFSTRTGVSFDPISAAEGSVDLTIKLLLNPQRAARLVEYHARNNQMPGLESVIDQLINNTYKSKVTTGYHGEIQRMVNSVTLKYLINLANNNRASYQTRAICFSKLDNLHQWMSQEYKRITNESQKAHLSYSMNAIAKFKDQDGTSEMSQPSRIPDGSPIGMDSYQPSMFSCDH